MKPLSEQTLYEILEIPVDAPAPDIESACERALSLYGPGSLATYTLMTSEQADLLTSRIEEARRTLLDPDARARYDASLSQPAAEPRAARANGTKAPAAARARALPPVIPALRVPAPSPPAPVATAELPAARPAILLEAAVQTADAPAEGPRPILLNRAVPGRLPTPVPAAEPAVDIPLPEGSVWTGEALRRIREARGITVGQIAERTKVTRHHVENIEADRFARLPAAVYLRGILFSLARELRLDGQKVARSYLERVAAAAAEAK